MDDFPNGYNAILGRPNMYFSYGGAVFQKPTVVLYTKVRLYHKPIKILYIEICISSYIVPLSSTTLFYLHCSNFH